MRFPSPLRLFGIWSSWEESGSPTIGLTRPILHSYWYTWGHFLGFAQSGDVDWKDFGRRLLKFVCQVLGEVRYGNVVVGLAHELFDYRNFAYGIKSLAEFTVKDAVDGRVVSEIQGIQEEETTEQGDSLNNAFSCLTLKEPVEKQTIVGRVVSSLDIGWTTIL